MINHSIGILGGGQLGKMLYTAGAPKGYDVHMMDTSHDFPGGKVSPKFEIGDFTNYDDVMRFGSTKDIVTIEIEKINVDALKALAADGKQVFPQPDIVELIQDKGKQKLFYQNSNLASSPFRLYSSIDELKNDIENRVVSFPFVQKIRIGGYDGRGVKIIRRNADLDSAFPSDFLIEALVDLQAEIAIMACRNISGQIVQYDPVEMVFDNENNILSYQFAPANFGTETIMKAQQLVNDLMSSLKIVGLLAVELFVDKSGQVSINEVAPRPHNSGHHTIEACWTSQYENHLRAISGLPLGEVKLRSPSLLMNLLGHPDYTGPAIYDGIEEVMTIPGVFVHIYGKEVTKPHRKMGHINILGSDRHELIDKYNRVKSLIKVIA